MITFGRLALAALLLVGCGSEPPAEPAADDSAPAITNRVAVPAAVRQNLGITFVKAEERVVAQTLRLAGHFTSPPSSRFPQHSSVPGTVQLHVAPLDAVDAGQLLASIASPEMLERRHHLHLAEDAIGAAKDALEIASAELAVRQGALDELKQRNARLKAAKSPRADLRTREAVVTREVDVLEARRNARRNELTRARHRFEAEILAFALTIGRPVEDIRESWEAQDVIELRAPQAGVVSEVLVSPGAWVATGQKLLEVRDPSLVWFTARVLNSDVDRLADGQRVRVLPQSRSTAATPVPAVGTLRLAPTGDVVGQTVPAHVILESPVPSWARAGIVGTAEVTVSGGGTPEVAIPAGALVRDGLQDVFFRRDPDDPDKVIRVDADRGPSDGRWVVLYSGATAGDEIVVDGAYELKLASSARPTVEGHFHADGTFHEGKD